nr:immunoglobulin light chain junction region [Macaca mulatta]
DYFCYSTDSSGDHFF